LERHRQGFGGNNSPEFATVTQRTKRHFYFFLAFVHQELKGVEKMAKISPIFKKVTSFVFSKPATAGYPYVKPQLQENFGDKCNSTANSV
jgi:hypothetical protein